MNSARIKAVALVFALATASLAGCSREEPAAPPVFVLPEVNDANCRITAIQAMPVDKDVQREFGSRCARRGTFTTSPPKSY